MLEMSESCYDIRRHYFVGDNGSSFEAKDTLIVYFIVACGVN